MRGSSHHGSPETNLTSIHEGAGLIPGFTQWLRTWCSCELGCRLAATASIRPLAWEPPYAMGAALKSKKKKKKVQWEAMGSVKRSSPGQASSHSQALPSPYFNLQS